MDKEIFIIFTALINLILGFIIYTKNKNIVNKSFLIFTITTSIWSIGLFFYTHPILFSALEWIKITYFLSTFTVPALFSFCFIFSKGKSQGLLRPLLFYWIITFPFILILFLTNWWVVNVVPQEFGFHTITGSAYIFYSLFAGIYILLAVKLLFQKYKKDKGTEKFQTAYILIGIVLYILFSFLVDVIFPIIIKSSEYFWLSPIFSVFFVFFTFLAILRYHLFDIRIILTELLVGIMGILLLVLPLIVPTNELKILATVLFLLFCIFGYLLIKTTHEQIQKREELERAYNELKELDETKTMFLSIASHQLRTPLSAMKGYLSMVLSGDYGVKIEGQVKEFLEKVYQSNERLINLVNDLLDITRLQMGKLQLNSQPVQIEEIVQSVVDEFSEQARQKNLSLVFKKPSAPLPKINVDPQKIRQVILNLIDNAIKYTKKGGITVKVQHNSSTNSKNGTILITVKDTGIGLTTKDINNLFQLFERSDSAVKTHAVGVGIGLYAAKEIVKAHKGKIWAESSGRDKGSTFYVELPVK